MPKGEAVITRISGVATIHASDKHSDQRYVRVENSEIVSDEYDIPGRLGYPRRMEPGLLLEMKWQ